MVSGVRQHSGRRATVAALPVGGARVRLAQAYLEELAARTDGRAWLTPRSRQVAKAVALILLAAEVAFVFLASPGGDAHAYWAAPLAHPYIHGMANTPDAYLYSPAFLEALTPLRLLPFPVFWACWVVGSVAILVWLVGPVAASLLLVPTPYNPVFTELWYGNIVMPMAVVIALGFRYPGLWSFMLLTKVTPGIGLLWFAVRREWRALTIGIGVTGAVAGASFLLSPTAWTGWAGTLMNNAAAPASIGAHLPGLAIRLPIAAGIVALGAWRGARWVMPVGIVLALPVFWFASLTLLLVWLRQVRDRHSQPSRGSLRNGEARRWSSMERRRAEARP